MSIEEEIKSKVREISRDLEEDRELQLDVELELESHIWESYDNARERGMSDEESEEHAFKEFGDTLEIKDRIVSGNLKRMKSRARLKLLLWYAFLPISMLAAVYLGWSEFSELSEVNRILDSNTRYLAEVDKDSPILPLRKLEQNLYEEFNEELYSSLVQQFPNNAYIDTFWLSANYEKFIDTTTDEIVDQQGYQTLIDKLIEMDAKSEFTAYHAPIKETSNQSAPIKETSNQSAKNYEH